MKPRDVIPGVEWVGAADWDRTMFDALIPLPDHTSYNAYLIHGSEKTVLVDTVDSKLVDVLMSRLEGVEQVDYILSLHAEQDHSGSLPLVLEKYPQARVLASPKCKEILVSHLLLDPERIHTVQDGENISLGDRTLQFIHIPWVHWPDTMAVWLVEEKLLFTTDFFGSHLATASLFASTDEARTLKAARRYYAEIMMPLRLMAQKNLQKLEAFQPALIAPSHGPVYDRPSIILEAYQQWLEGPMRNAVVLPFISMHGSTFRIVSYFAESLADRGVAVDVFDLVSTDLGELASALVDAPTLVVGSPTVLGGPHPSAVSAAYLVNMLKPRLKYLSVVGSYAWGAKTVETLADLVSSLKLEILPPVMCKGLPVEVDLQALDALAELIVEKQRAL